VPPTTSVCTRYFKRDNVDPARGDKRLDTSDALLVAEKSKAQQVAKIVPRLRQSNRREHGRHLRNLRPWGHFESLSAGTRFQVKLLGVKPRGRLSMQMHHIDLSIGQSYAARQR
jgi:hypothetical protein